LIVEVAAAGDTTAPAAPSAVAAVAANGSVALDWADNVEPDLAGYRLYRTTGTAAWPTTPVASPTGSAFTDTGVVNGTTYQYRVTAVDSAGNESAPSAVVTASPAGGTAPPPACGTRNPYSDAVLATSTVVGYWRLGESSGIVACGSTGAINGEYVNAPTLGQPGLVYPDTDRSVRLDGVNDHVRVLNAPALNPTAGVSVEAWVAPASLPASQAVVRKDTQYLLRILGQSLWARVWWSDGTYTEVTSPAVMSVNAAQHVVLSYDGSAIRLFRNGDVVATKAVVGKTIKTSTSPLYVGQSGGYDYFVGTVDEVAVYAGGLSAESVRDHYRAAGGKLQAPTSVTAVGGATAIGLRWSPVGAEGSGYRVYRAGPDGAWPATPIV
jgi:chitodextrinase